MKFTIEHSVFEQMVRQVGQKLPNQRRADTSLRLSACAARVFVESNQTVAGTEALVLEEGGCTLPRVKFLRVLETYRSRQHLTVEADAHSLRIGGFSMPVASYSPQVQAPGDFQVFPVTDLNVLTPAQGPTPQPGARTAPVADLTIGSTGETCPAEKISEEAPVPARALDWSFFTPETLECLLVLYTHGYELEWAERMWAALAECGLTRYAGAHEYNRVLVRLAVLARYFKCWVWRAYDEIGNPYWEYEEWFEALPWIRSAFPSAQQEKFVDSETTRDTRDLLAQLIKEENNAVFEAILRTYDEPEECQLALDLRHAAGAGDYFDSHVSFGDRANDLEDQVRFLNEHEMSMRELDALNMVFNRFVF